MVIESARAASDLLGGLVDRWAKAKAAKLDAVALVRLLRLEARHNLEVLDVAVGAKERLPVSVLWQVPPLLQTEIVESILGLGEAQHTAFRVVQKLQVSQPDKQRDFGGFLSNLYVRTRGLQTLALLGAGSSLAKVRIDKRLRNLHSDMLLLVRSLDKESAE
jgi:hypothetical protein